MSDPVKKLQWGYTGMIPFSETAEKLGLHAYVQIENYQFMQKRADNLESENASLKAEVEAVTQEYRDATNHYNKLYNDLQAEVERLRKAGDAMAYSAYAHCMCQDCEELRDQWRDAKRGNQP